MWQQFLENKEWILSGIGTAAVTAIVTHLFSLGRFVSLTGVRPLRLRRVYKGATVKAIRTASQRLYLCYSRLEASISGDRHVRAFNKELNDIARSSRVKSVVLLAQKPDRLPCAYEFARNNVEVYFSSDYDIFDLRYVLADGRLAVIGEKTTTGGNENYSVSTRWREISSPAIVQLLRNRFDDILTDSTTIRFEQYAHYCAFLYRNDRASLSMPEEFWADFLSARFSAEGHVPLVLIIGRPGSGKSTFVRRAMAHLPRNAPLQRCVHIPDYDFFKEKFKHVDAIDGIAQRMDEGFLLENPAATFGEATRYVIERIKERSFSAAGPDMIFVEIARAEYLQDIKALVKAGAPPDYVVYLDAPFSVCCSRNRERPNRLEGDRHVVSKEEMDRTYSVDDLADLRSELGDRLLVLKNASDGEGHVESIVRAFVDVAMPRSIAA